MKARFFLFFLLVTPLAAQVSNPSVVPVTVAPSGACVTYIPIRLLTPDGTLYTCQNATWGVVGSGGGSITLPFVFGTATGNLVRWEWPTTSANTAYGGAPYAASSAIINWSGFNDNAWSLGYNCGPQMTPIDATKPLLCWQDELDYFDGANHTMEAHLNIFPVVGSASAMRPFQSTAVIGSYTNFFTFVSFGLQQAFTIRMQKDATTLQPVVSVNAGTGTSMITKYLSQTGVAYYGVNVGTDSGRVHLSGGIDGSTTKDILIGTDVDAANVQPFIEIGSSTGYNNGILYGNTPLARVDSSTGTVFVAGGSTFGISGCSVSAHTGLSNAGVFTLGANSCTAVITPASTNAAPHGWTCAAHDRTSPAVLIDGESSSTTTTASITIPVGAGSTDVISFFCQPY